MNIFVDEFGEIFCEFTKGIYSKITKDYFEQIIKTKLIKNIEFCIGDINV